MPMNSASTPRFTSIPMQMAVAICLRRITYAGKVYEWSGRDRRGSGEKISIWKRSQLKRIADASSTEERQEARQRTDLRIRALGSGSDYTVFLDHLA